MGTVRQYKFSETGKWGKSTNQMDPGKQTMENIEKPPELGQHTAHSQSEMKVDKKREAEQKRKKFNIYV